MTIAPRALGALAFLYLAAYLADTFQPAAAWRHIMLAALAGIHLMAFRRLKRANLILCALLAVSGALLLLHHRAGADDWAAALLNNAPIICLLLTAPLFTIPLYFEPYHQVLHRSLPRFAATPFRFYALAFAFTAALTSLLNVAGLPFVHNLLKDTAARGRDDALALALTRGITVNMLWSPAFISVAVVMQYAAVTWYELLLAGALLALAAFLLALLLGVREFSARITPAHAHAPAAGDRLAATLAKLFLSLVILLAFIVLLQHLTGKSALVTVPLASVTGPLLLALLFARLGVYRAKAAEYFTATLPNTYGETILFTAFGFFGYALGLSDIKDYIPLAIRWLGFDSPLTLIPLVTLLTAFPCLFGIHPVITISAVAIALPPGSIALNKIQMAGALLLAYMNYGNLSPFSAVNLVVLGLTKADALKATFRSNWPHALALTVAGTLLLAWLPN